MSQVCVDGHYGKIHVIGSTSKPDEFVCVCACGNTMILSETEILSQNCHKACSEYRGEVCAAEIFDLLNIPYITQMHFDDTDLVFDFYLPDQNIIIECDGAQHWRAADGWDSDYKLQETRQRDEDKQEYCKRHGITLYQIPFWDKEKLAFEYLKSIL